MEILDFAKMNMAKKASSAERNFNSTIRYFSIDSIYEIKSKFVAKGVPRANTVSAHRCIINEFWLSGLAREKPLPAFC